MALRISIVPHVPLSLGYGGLEVQQEQTIEALLATGTDVQRFDPWSTRFDADILHVFGSFHHQAETVFRATAKGIPVVVTSMFVRTRSPLAYSFAKYSNVLGLRTLYSVRKELLASATRIVALSHMEKQDLSDVFDIDESKIDVIGNGVEERFFSATPDAFHSAYKIDECILCVATVEPNKNQLELINAIEPTGIPLVLVGGPKPYAVGNVKEYIDSVRRRCAVSSSVTWIEGLDHYHPLLASAYAAARVHVLPSLAEGQGIASLEAAATGASICMSDLPTLRSIYGPDAMYFDPTSATAIRQTVTDAWKKGRGNASTSSDGKRPQWLVSWGEVALQLNSTYRRCMDTYSK